MDERERGSAGSGLEVESLWRTYYRGRRLEVEPNSRSATGPRMREEKIAKWKAESSKWRQQSLT